MSQVLERQQVPELPPEFTAYAKIIENAATNPDVDVEKLKQLMEMQIAIMDRAARMQFNAAMADVQSLVPPVVCDKVNLHTKSKYPSMENVQMSIKDIYLAHGFTCTFAEGDAPVDGRLHVTGTVRHAGGHTEVFNRYAAADTSGPSGTRNKTDVQGSQSTVTYLSRRLLCAIWGVTIVDEDKDGNTSVALVSKEQVAELKKMATATKSDLKKFCEHFKIESIDKLPASKYEDAVAAFTKKLARITPDQAADLQAIAEEVKADIAKFCQEFGVKIIANIPANRYADALSSLEKRRAA